MCLRSRITTSGSRYSKHLSSRISCRRTSVNTSTVEFQSSSYHAGNRLEPSWWWALCRGQVWFSSKVICTFPRSLIRLVQVVLGDLLSSESKLIAVGIVGIFRGPQHYTAPQNELWWGRIIRRWAPEQSFGEDLVALGFPKRKWLPKPISCDMWLVGNPG